MKVIFALAVLAIGCCTADNYNQMCANAPKDGLGQAKLVIKEKCGQYLYCDNSNVRVMNCPAMDPPLVFDGTTGKCVSVEKSGRTECGCTTPTTPCSTTTTPCSTTTTPCPTTTTPCPTTTTPCPTTTPKPPKDCECLRIPKPGCCDKFLQCCPKLKCCPAGLHFNPKTGECDNPSACGCKY